MEKKKYLALILTWILCLCLTACGSGTDTIPDSITDLVMDDSIQCDYSDFLGTWTGEDGNTLLVEEYNNRTRYEFCDADDDLLASGEFQYAEKYGYVYAYNEHDGIAHRCWFDENATLYIDSYGTFTKVSGDVPGETIGDLTAGTDYDFSQYTGIWLGEANNQYDFLEIDEDGSWQLYLSGDVVDQGFLRYEPEWDAVYAYSDQDGSGSPAVLEDGQLYITSFGYFNYGEGMENLWYENGGDHDGNASDSSSDESTDPALYHRDVSELEGVWYFDCDLSAETYIVIDGSGNWSYYQRAPGAEPAEMDYGVLLYGDEANIYYAESSVYDSVSYQVFDLDDDVLVWGDEGSYYLME